MANTCEERKSDNLIHFSYLLSLSENIEIQHRYIGFSSFCISKLEITVQAHQPWQTPAVLCKIITVISVEL